MPLGSIVVYIAIPASAGDGNVARSIEGIIIMMCNNNTKGSMSWMLVTHIGFMGLLLFWDAIPRSYLWAAYVALGIFLLSHFVSLFSTKGGCRGGHDHEESVVSRDRV